MARLVIQKYYAVLLLVIGVICTHADDTENSERDMETRASRNQLLDSMFKESLKLAEYVFERSEELCEKILDDDIYKNETSEALESHEIVLRNCVNRVVDRFDPTGRHHRNCIDEILLPKYRFENIQKVVNQKYEDFFKEIVQRIDDYVKGLTAVQQSETMARNLRKWSSKIKNAPTLARKDMAFRRCMRYYYFEGGV